MLQGNTIFEISWKNGVGFKNKLLVNSIETMADGSFNLFYQLYESIAIVI